VTPPAHLNAALAGVALHLSGGVVLVALAENWQQNRMAGCSAKARKIGVLLASQLITGAGLEIGVSRVGLSADNGFLTYLVLWRSGSFAASLAVIWNVYTAYYWCQAKA